MQLISRIIRSGEMDAVLEWGIQPEDFRTGVASSMFQYLLTYYSLPESRGSIIGVNASYTLFPHFVLCDDEHMTTAALCAEVRKNRIALELNQKMEAIRKEIEYDPIGSSAKLQQLSTEMLQLGSGKSTDVYFGGASQQILNYYQQQKAGMNFSMGWWPWEPLQEATGGIMPDDYVVIYGRPKSYKSWVLAYIAACLFMQNKRIIIYTKEMTAENIFKRIIACIAGIPYQDFRLGRLDPYYEERLYHAANMINTMQSQDRIITLSGKDATKGGDTVPWLHSKVRTYKPDAVFVDGLYLMSDVHRNKQPHEKVRGISNDLRQLVLEEKTPLLATLQANRKAAGHNEANMDELAFSDSIGQDATLVMRVINEKNGTALMVPAGAREVDLNGFRINANPAMDFSFKELITAKEIEKAKENDTGESDNPEAHVKNGVNGHKVNGHETLQKPTAQDAERRINQTIQSWTKLNHPQHHGR
jgi:hypothetical protein